MGPLIHLKSEDRHIVQVIRAQPDAAPGRANFRQQSRRVLAESSLKLSLSMRFSFTQSNLP